MIEVGTVIGLSKLVLDCAKAYGETRRRKHGLQPSLLIDLHERLRQLQSATDVLRDQKLNPNLSSASSAIRVQWYRKFVEALDLLNAVDIATVRVYSPELADWLGQRLEVSEALALDAESIPPVPQEYASQLLKLHDEVNKVSAKLMSTVLVPILAEAESTDELTRLSKSLQDCTTELSAFIRLNWPPDKL